MFFWIVIMANYEDKCFLELFLKAWSMKRNFKLYDSEKKSIKEGVYKCRCPEFSKCNKTGCCSSNTGVKKLSFSEKLLNDGNSMRNFVLKSIFGFIGGILLTYSFFIFLVFSLNFTLKKATYICMVLGVILSLGLAFSVRIRCTVFLCIPQLFSKRGRQALLAYAFILALSGPAKNTLHNVEVMSESLACKQQQLQQVENELLQYVEKPNSAAKKLIEKLLEDLNSAVKYFKNFILQLYRTCLDVLSMDMEGLVIVLCLPPSLDRLNTCHLEGSMISITSFHRGRWPIETVLHSRKWLYSITTLCKKKTGRPGQRCLYFLKEASENCQGISSMRYWQEECRIKASSQKLICFSSAKNFCHKRDISWCLPADELQKKLRTFKRRAINILYVKVKAHQIYCRSNRSNVQQEEVQGVATEIRQKTDQFLQYFDFMSLIFGIFILVLFVKVIIYRYKFLTDDNYDNRYITHDFVEIDNTRAEFKMQTLLPLEPREKAKYIKVTSIRLVPCEKVRLMSSFIFLLFASFKIIIHMLTDSSLYWLLSNIRREEKLLYMSHLREEEPSVTVRVVGDGLVADFVRNVTKAVKRQSATSRLDPTPCLPDPIPPDLNRYYQILSLVIICWFLALFEPYGLRLRHTVMVSYHPDRARERAIWLYNQIISDRSSFVKLARRDLRKRYKNVPKEDTLRFRFFLNKSAPKCLLCKITLNSTYDQVKCTTFDCPGLFCSRCFDCLKLCSICNDPAGYGDLSDVSEEKDSSEDESLCKCFKERKTTEKPIQKTDKIKEGFKLKVRKPHFNICAKEGNHSKHLIRPELLNALGFRKSRNGSEKQKNLSELESSDWEASFSSDSSENSVKQKIFCGKEVEKGRKNKNAKKMKKLEDIFQSGPETYGQKVSLFQKVSELVQNRERGQFSERKAKRPPDFLFKKYKKDLQEGSGSYKDQSFLKSKNGIEAVRKCLKKKQELSGKQSNEESAMDGSNSYFMSSEDVPTPISVKYYDMKEKQYPFIDPINIHEISHKWRQSQEEIDFLEEEEDFGTRHVLEWSPPVTSKVTLTLPDTDSAEENFRLTITEQMTSSPDTDCQFYSQPFKTSVRKLKQRKKKSGLKRTSGKLNIKTRQFLDFYSIETDSSKERVLSVKPVRRVHRRRIKGKPVTLDEKSKKILKTVGSFSKLANSRKKANFWKTTAGRWLRKKRGDRRCTKDDSSSETEGEHLLKATVFISDEEFEKISRSFSGQLEKNNRISSCDTWTLNPVSDPLAPKT